MRVGIIRFPGSNCDYDALNFFAKNGHVPFFVWYKERVIPKCDLVVLPGGFAFGDRVYEKATAKYTINPGVLALRSPIMSAVRKFAAAGKPILGICNGFQILVKAGLLPGALERNESKRFFCDWTICKIMGASVFGDARLLRKKLRLPVAHGYGRYRASSALLRELKANDQIFLKYDGANPNGSVNDIAGICNKEKTIFGLMPHPERARDGAHFIRAIERYVGKR
ncbi:MAG: phosphoribosylformylglycinamidine synthase I [Candidatus Niyogibacteria bacterium]|nr:phosphoribosylformylglycinamidine synthase I [Candidatus Niyogibacteria bacterium]